MRPQPTMPIRIMMPNPTQCDANSKGTRHCEARSIGPQAADPTCFVYSALDGFGNRGMFSDTQCRPPRLAINVEVLMPTTSQSGRSLR